MIYGLLTFSGASIPKKSFLFGEVLTILYAVLFVWLHGLTPDTVLTVLVAPVLVTLALTDGYLHKIFDRTLIWLIPLLLCRYFYGFLVLSWDLQDALLLLAGGAMGFLLFYLMAVFSKMGGGDIKLMTLLGLWLGALPLYYVIFGVFLGAGVVVSVLLILKKVTRKQVIPLGPFITISTLVVFWLEL